MDYKYSWVVDSGGFLKTIVLQWLRPIYSPPILDADGNPAPNQEATSMEWIPESYTLADGDYMVDVQPPHSRAHAGDVGIVVHRWDGVGWVEGATTEEIAAWELDHPAPPPAPPSALDKLQEENKLLTARVTALAEQNDFQEELIVELAGVIYA